MVSIMKLGRLTDGIFETGAYGVSSKSQNPTVLGQGGPSSTQCSNPSWACRWHHPFGPGWCRLDLLKKSKFMLITF